MTVVRANVQVRRNGGVRRCRWGMWACVLLLMLAFFTSLPFVPAQAQAPAAMTAREKREKFREIRNAGYKAWIDKRWQEAERLLLEAATYGELTDDELRFLSYVRRAQLYRAEESLPLAQFLYAKTPSFANVLELVESYADNGQNEEARAVMAKLLNLSSEQFTTPVADFEMIGTARSEERRGG